MLEVVSQAKYMVLGLGDVYLGAPCAVPVDPRSVRTTLSPTPLTSVQGRNSKCCRLASVSFPVHLRCCQPVENLLHDDMDPCRIP